MEALIWLIVIVFLISALNAIVRGIWGFFTSARQIFSFQSSKYCSVWRRRGSTGEWQRPRQTVRETTT